MIYIINIIFSCMYLSLVKENRFLLYLVKISPVIILWTIIIGGQYDIGADYFNYYDYFSNPALVDRFEPLFQIITKFIYNFKTGSQTPFFIYAFIIAFKMRVKNLGLFCFLIITVSTFFNNQMNGLRQCIAIPIACWGMIELYKSKLKGCVLIVLAGGFHYSALICLAFLYIKKVVNIITANPKLLLLLTIIVTCIPSTDTLNNTIINFLPEFIREETVYEKAYLDNENLAATTGLIYKLSKLLLIPIYFISLRMLVPGKLNEDETDFFKLGLMSYSLRCVLLVNNLVGRFSGFFWIFSIFPIYYLASDYWKRQKYFKFFMLLIYSSLIYFVKVFVGTAEYKSSFIYFM